MALVLFCVCEYDKKIGTRRNMSKILEHLPGSAGFRTFKVRNEIRNMHPSYLKHQILDACRNRALLTYWDNETQTIKFYTEAHPRLIREELIKIKRRVQDGNWSGESPHGTEGSPRHDRITIEGFKL